MKSNSWLSRRIILVNGARAIAAAVFGSRLPPALAAPAPAPGEQATKTRMQDTDFNLRFSALRGNSQFAAEMTEAKASLPEYLARHFEVTPALIRGVRALPPEDLKALNTALDRAVSEGLLLKISGLSNEKGPCTHLVPTFSGDTLTIEVKRS